MANFLKNLITGTAKNLITSTINNAVNRNSSTNVKNASVTQPTQYKTPAQPPVQTTTPVKTTPIIQNVKPVNTQYATPVNSTPAMNNQSRFIGFQNNFGVQNQFTQQAQNVINGNTAQQNIKKAGERKVFPVYTHKQQVADYNKIQDYKYRTREEAIKDFHYDVRNTNGQLTAEDIAEKYPEFKNNVQDALKLQEALLPYVRDDEFAPMKAITENFPNLLPAKQQKTYDDSQDKKFDERINYMKTQTNYDALSDYGKVFYDNMMALNDVAERVRKNYKVGNDATNLDIILTAINNEPADGESGQGNIYKKIYDDMIMAGKKLDNSDLRQLSKGNLKRWMYNPIMELQAELSKKMHAGSQQWNELIREPLNQIAEEAKQSIQNTKSLPDFNKKYLEKAIDATNAIVNIPGTAISGADRVLTNKIQLSNWNDTKSFGKNISEKLENITKIGGGAIETFFNTVASPVTVGFHAVGATPVAGDILNSVFESVPNAVDFYMSGKWRQTISDITLGDEGTRIGDLLGVKGEVASSIISDWYNNELDDQGRADFQNSVFMALGGAKGKTKGKTPTFDKLLTNGKINAGAIADGIIDTIKQGKNWTSFSLFLKKKMLENDRTQMLPDRPGKVNDNVGYTEYKGGQLRGQDYLDAVTEGVGFAKNRFIENFKEGGNVDKAIEQRKAYEANKETIQNWEKAGSPTIKEGQTKVGPVREEGTEITEYTGEYGEPEVKAPEKGVVEKVKEGVKNTVENINNTVKNSFSNLIKRKSGNQEQQPQQGFSKSGVTDNGLNQLNNTKNIGEVNTKPLNNAQNQLIQNYNRMNPKAIQDFETRYGESYGQYMADRGFTKAGEDNLNDMVTYQKDLMNIKENALNKIDGKFNDVAIQDMLDVLNDFYTKTKDRKNLAIIQNLINKHNNGGLSMSEINNARKKFQYDIRTNFFKDGNSEKIQLANNVYLAVKDFLDKTAKENGLDSLDDINREIMKVQHIIGGVSYKMRGSSANNTLGLTDYITLASMLSNPAGLAVFLGKQALKTNGVKNFILDKAIGRKGNAKNRITADKMQSELERIAEINDKKARDKALEDFYDKFIKPVKELSEYFDNSVAEFKRQFNESIEKGTLDNALPDKRNPSDEGKNVITGKNQVTIEVDEQGNSRRKGQISESDKRSEENKKDGYIKSESEPKNLVTAKPKAETPKEEPEKPEVNDDTKKYLYDKNGKQKNVYHYSDTDFKEFDLDKQKNKLGIYFSPSSKPTSKLRKYKITATIDMNKPLVISPKNKASQIYPELKELLSDELENQYDTKFRELLLRDGYDGVIMLDDKGVVSQYVVLNPEQVNIKKQGAIQPQTKNEVTKKEPEQKKEEIANKEEEQKKENSELKAIVGDEYYKFLERQVEIANESRKGIKEPITIDDLDITSQFYENKFHKMYEVQRKALLDEINKYPIAKLDGRLTEKQEKILEKTESEEEKKALYTKWREERMKEWDMSDEDIAKIEDIMQKFNKLSEQREKYYNYILDWTEKKNAKDKVTNTKNAVTSKKQETATEFMDRLERENAEDIKAQQSDLFNMPETEDIEAIDRELTAKQQSDLRDMPETEDIEALDNINKKDTLTAKKGDDNLIKDTKNYKFNDFKDSSIDSMLVTDGFEKYKYEEDGQTGEGYAGYINGKAVDIIPDKENDIIRINVGDELMRSYDDSSINVQLKDSDNIISVVAPYDDAGFKAVLARVLGEKAPELGKPSDVIYKKGEGVFKVYDDIGTLRMNARPGDKLLGRDGKVYDLGKEFDNAESRDGKLYYANTRNPNSRIESRDYFKDKDIIGISKGGKINTDIESQKAVISDMSKLSELNNILENKKTSFEGELGGTPVKVEALNSNYDRLNVDYLDDAVGSDRVSKYELTTNKDPYGAKFYETFEELKSDLESLVNGEDIGPKNAITNKAEVKQPKNAITSESKVDKIVRESEGQELKVINNGDNRIVMYKVNGEDRAYTITKEQLDEVNSKKNGELINTEPVKETTEQPKNLVTAKTKQETVVEKIIRESDGAELKYDEDINGDNKTISFTANGKDYTYSVTNSDLKELSNRGRLEIPDEKAEKQAKIDKEIEQNIKAFENEKPKNLVTNPNQLEAQTKVQEKPVATEGKIQETDKETYRSTILKNPKEHPREMFIYKDGSYYYPSYILPSGKIITPENTYWGEVASEDVAREWLIGRAKEYSAENEAKKSAKLKELGDDIAKKYEETLKRIEADNPMYEIWTHGDYFKYGMKDSQVKKAKKESDANAEVGTFKKDVIEGKEGYRIFVAGGKEGIRAFYEPKTGKTYRIYKGPMLDDSRPFTTNQVDRIEKFLGNVEKQLEKETKKEKVEKKPEVTKEWLDSLKPDNDGIVDLDPNGGQYYALVQGKEALVKEGKADGKYLRNYGGEKRPQYDAVYVKDGISYEGRKGLDNQYMTTRQEAVDWLNQKEKDVEHEATAWYTQTDYEPLPKTISVEAEAEKVGPKRIAPDRIKWQQETYDEGLNNVKNIVKSSPFKIYELGFKSDRSKAVQDIMAERKRIRELPEAEAENQWNELARGIYEDLVIKDISKGYRYPEDVTSRFPKAQMKKAVDARARYEKGLFTSFSAKDTRANNQYRDEIGAGIKSQDGKPVTQEQMNEIVDGIRNYSQIFGLDMKKFAEDNGIVYVHLHGGNPFLMGGSVSIGGLYRQGEGNRSVSLGGKEGVMEKGEDGEMKKTDIKTTTSHELTHAIDGMLEWELFSRADKEILKKTMNKPNHLVSYYNNPKEITARAVEQYVAHKIGKNYYYRDIADINFNKGEVKFVDKDYNYVNRQAYWNQENFDKYVKPIVERNMKEKLGDYFIKDNKSEESTSKNAVTANSKNELTNKRPL